VVLFRFLNLNKNHLQESRAFCRRTPWLKYPQDICPLFGGAKSDAKNQALCALLPLAHHVKNLEVKKQANNFKTKKQKNWSA
jgi:hypothetical protein